MARIARVVAPGLPHHVTQRGNRRMPTFFGDEDYRAYLDLLGEWTRREGVRVWGYCLMPNHVHLIVVPGSEAGLCRAISEDHRPCTRRVNFREEVMEVMGTDTTTPRSCGICPWNPWNPCP